MHACKCANCFVSCRSGIPSQNPRGRGTAHSLIWSKMCHAEQGLVLRVFSIKHVIQFYFLASRTREIILEKKPLKECNGSREAVYIQTRYYFVSFAKKNTNKQINRKNVDRDTATAVANYSGLGYLYIYIKNMKY